MLLSANITAVILYLSAGIYCAKVLNKGATNNHGPQQPLRQSPQQFPQQSPRQSQPQQQYPQQSSTPSAVKSLALKQPLLSALITLAVALHGIGVYGVIVNPGGLALGFFKVSALITWCINLIVLISGLYKPLHNLWIFLLPLSIVTIILSLVSHSPLWPDITFGIAIHILFSILAYSLFSIAMLQAILLAWQSYRLKQCKLKGLGQLMPPLETMETLLFEIVWVGQILLTLGIIAGVIYIDNILMQHLVHKTLLSLLAWLIFALLLLGRYWMGWRGNTAIRWIISGFCLLMLAFFGSKLVLEIILRR